MVLDLGEDPIDTALRFGIYTPGVHAGAVVSVRIEHVQADLRSVARGPLAPDLY